MRVKSYVVATVISLVLWVASYHAAAASYHLAQDAGLMPSLHIKATIASLFG